MRAWYFVGTALLGVLWGTPFLASGAVESRLTYAMHRGVLQNPYADLHATEALETLHNQTQVNGRYIRSSFAFDIVGLNKRSYDRQLHVSIEARTGIDVPWLRDRVERPLPSWSLVARMDQLNSFAPVYLVGLSWQPDLGGDMVIQADVLLRNDLALVGETLQGELWWQKSLWKNGFRLSQSMTYIGPQGDSKQYGGARAAQALFKQRCAVVIANWDVGWQLSHARHKLGVLHAHETAMAFFAQVLL
ncbi:MAG: hypothetical protein OXT67_07105 [Zetaproteobacteria bacterium]|nr:hypothetical protein [Zetaproteobacteria bacterium]